jgi:hypothetical protein
MITSGSGDFRSVERRRRPVRISGGSGYPWATNGEVHRGLTTLRAGTRGPSADGFIGPWTGTTWCVRAGGW